MTWGNFSRRRIIRKYLEVLVRKKNQFLEKRNKVHTVSIK